MQYRKVVTMAAIAGSALAFGGTQAAAQQGTYRLAEVAGAPLPIVVEEEDGCVDEVVQATLTLSADSTWTLVMTERETCGDEVSEEEETEEGTYTIEAQSIEFVEDDADDDDDPDDDDDEEDDDELEIDELAVGTLGANALTVRLEDGATTLVFRM